METFCYKRMSCQISKALVRLRLIVFSTVPVLFLLVAWRFQRKTRKTSRVASTRHVLEPCGAGIGKQASTTAIPQTTARLLFAVATDLYMAMEASAASDETLAAVFAQLKLHTVALLDLLRTRRPISSSGSSLREMAAFLRAAPAPALQLCFELIVTSPSALHLFLLSWVFGLGMLICVSSSPVSVIQCFHCSCSWMRRCSAGSKAMRRGRLQGALI
jgi:hypothetical protein